MKRLLSITFAYICLCAPAHATQVQEVVSPSGIKAWLVEEHSLPLLAIRVVFTDSGTANEPANKGGVSNAVAAMLMEGAGDMDSRLFNESLESNAIRMNASSDEDDIQAAVEALSEKKEEAFYHLGLALTAPRFDETAFERVQKQTFSLLEQQAQEPGYQAYRALHEMAFGQHPYARPALGTHESVQTLTPADLKQFAASHLTRENMVIAVSGDISPETLSQLLDKHLAKLPAAYTGIREVAEAKIPTQGQTRNIDFAIPQTITLFGTQGLKRNDPEYFTAYVMNYILGGGGSLSSLISSEIREKRGLAYSVSSHIDPMIHGAMWRGGFSTRTEKAPEAIATLKTTLKQFVTNGPTPQQLDDAKQYLTGSFVLSLDSNASITAFLVSMQQNKLGRDYFDKRNGFVDAVTREGVKAMAKRLIDPDNLLLVSVGKNTQPAPAKGP